MLGRITQIILIVLILIGVGVFIQTLTQPEPSFDVQPNYDPILYVCYIFSFITIFIALAGFIFGIALTPKRIVGFLAGLVPLLIILGVGYGMASDMVPNGFDDLSPDTSKLVGMGLYSTYFLGVLAVIAVAFSSVSKLVK